MTLGFGDHDELQCARSGISNAMRISRRNVKRLGGLKFNGLVANLHGRFSPKDIKELLSLMMEMQQFTASRRHFFLDDGQFRVLQEEPGFAFFTPIVLHGIHRRNWSERRRMRFVQVK